LRSKATRTTFGPGDYEGAPDVCVRRVTGETTRVGLRLGCTRGNLNSFSPSISADGRFVASKAGGAQPDQGDTNSTTDASCAVRTLEREARRFERWPTHTAVSAGRSTSAASEPVQRDPVCLQGGCRHVIGRWRSLRPGVRQSTWKRGNQGPTGKPMGDPKWIERRRRRRRQRVVHLLPRAASPELRARRERVALSETLDRGDRTESASSEVRSSAGALERRRRLRRPVAFVRPVSGRRNGRTSGAPRAVSPWRQRRGPSPSEAAEGTRPRSTATRNTDDDVLDIYNLPTRRHSTSGPRGGLVVGADGDVAFRTSSTSREAGPDGRR